MYLTFDEYQKMGGKLSQPAFDVLEKQSERALDYYTQNRIRDLKDIPQEVKELMFRYVNMEQSAAETERVTSFSNDGVSVTFADSTGGLSTSNQMYNLAVEYLPLELINCGVV